MLCLQTTAAARTNWICGTYVSKNDDDHLSHLIKLVISPAENDRYKVTATVRRFFNDDVSKKPFVITGYATGFGSVQSKEIGRYFARFPKAKYTPFIEIIPGKWSSPVRNKDGFLTITYTFYEDYPSGSYSAGELFRLESKKK